MSMTAHRGSRQVPSPVQPPPQTQPQPRSQPQSRQQQHQHQQTSTPRNMPKRSELIACQNCAKLKVTCDKNLPCKKCVDRSIPCEPRYTRRRLTSEISSSASREATKASQSRRTSLANGNTSSTGSRVTAAAPAAAATTTTTTTTANTATSSSTTSTDTIAPHVHDPRHLQPWVAMSPHSVTYNVLIQPQNFLPDAAYPAVPASSVYPASLVDTSSIGAPTLSDGLDPSMPPPSSVMSRRSSEDQPRPWKHDAFDIDLDSLFADDYSHIDLMSQTSSTDFQTMSTAHSPPFGLGPQKRRRSSSCVPQPPLKSRHASPDDSRAPPPTPLEALPGDEFSSHWSSFRCNPVDSSSPPSVSIARHSLAGLSLREASPLHQPDPTASVPCEVLVEALDAPTRDKLVAINCTFAERALKLHRVAPLSGPRHAALDDHRQFQRDDDNSITLPPSSALERFLRAYVLRLEHTYPSIPSGTLKTNKLIWDNSKHGALQLLLMVALGSMASADPHEKNMSKALTEACRVRLAEVLERRQRLDATKFPVVLRSALLFTLLGSWSGTKFYMDLALAQQGIYMPMIRQASFWGGPDFRELPEHATNPELLWKDWKKHESKKRLVYSCMTAFLELSIFHDIPSTISVKDLELAEPASDDLWHAKDAETFHQLYMEAKTQPRPSVLLSWCRNLTAQQIWSSAIKPTPTQLGYCLHVLAILTHNTMQLQDSLPMCGGTSGSELHQSMNSEIKSLFSVWYSLAQRHCRDSNEYSLYTSAMTANMVKFHLLNLTTIVRFADIERIAREGPSWKSARLCAGAIADPVEAWIHVGQILRLIRAMPAQVRPLWSAAAIYRAALVAWAISLAHIPNQTPDAQPFGIASYGMSNADRNVAMPPASLADAITAQLGDPAVFPLDGLPLDDPKIQAYRDQKQGTAVLTGSHMQPVPLIHPQDVLQVFVDVLDLCETSDFVVGIKKKLHLLLVRWHSS